MSMGTLEKRKVLRSYQEENKDICIKALEKHDKVVLAMSPNAGKTLTASRTGDKKWQKKN